LADVYLNHLMRVVDREVIDALRGSTFIKRRFATFSESTVEADHGNSWHGLYLMGRHTYIEIFSPSRKMKLEPGDFGIGLGVEEPGGVDLAYQALRRRFRTGVKRGSRKRLVGGKLVPWFREVDVKPAGFWVMEYLKDYMDAEKPTSLSKSDKISRERYNRPSFNARGYLLDVTGVTLALGPPLAQRLASGLEALGYEIEPHRSRKICRGSGVSFTLVPAKQDDKITQIDMILQRPVAKPISISLGSSSLNLTENKAHWVF
jgi:uncharacterized protein DUF5829